MFYVATKKKYHGHDIEKEKSGAFFPISEHNGLLSPKVALQLFFKCVVYKIAHHAGQEGCSCQ